MHMRRWARGSSTIALLVQITLALLTCFTVIKIWLVFLPGSVACLTERLSNAGLSPPASCGSGRGRRGREPVSLASVGGFQLAQTKEQMEDFERWAEERAKQVEDERLVRKLLEGFDPMVGQVLEGLGIRIEVKSGVNPHAPKGEKKVIVPPEVLPWPLLDAIADAVADALGANNDELDDFYASLDMSGWRGHKDIPRGYALSFACYHAYAECHVQLKKHYYHVWKFWQSRQRIWLRAPTEPEDRNDQ